MQNVRAFLFLEMRIQCCVFSRALPIRAPLKCRSAILIALDHRLPRSHLGADQRAWNDVAEAAGQHRISLHAAAAESSGEG